MEQVLEYFLDKEERGNKDIYRGFTINNEDNFIKNKLLSLNFTEIEEFGNNVRWVLVNRDLKAVYIHCEGDISIELFKTDKDYEDNLKKMKKFYDMY